MGPIAAPSEHRSGGAVASPHAAATAVGRDVLAAGGNALDAAIATNAMLGAVYPHMCGIGGDLLLLFHDARTGTVHALNGTGPAPALATPEAYAGRGLDEVPARGPLSITVPGAVRAWAAAVGRFGSLPLAELLAPAIAAAADGIEVTARMADWIGETRDEIAGAPGLARFATAGTGTRVRLPELAGTLERLARKGADDLYAGELGAAVAAAAEAAGGLLRAEDLRAYEPEWVAPLRMEHAGLEVLTTPPNSQGVVALLMLRAMGAAPPPLATPAYVDAFVAAKRAAFAVRDAHVTDPRHMRVTAADLLEGSLAAAGSPATPPPGGDTVHLCTADADGNACSLIQSLYYGFGSGFVAGDTGIVLHNRGHGFSLDPAAANVIAPGKRTLHTLMACMALDRGRPRFVFGTMGADGQAQTNVQVLHRLLAGAGPAEAVAAPRILHGRFALEDDPETLHVEADYEPATLAALRETVAALEVVPPRSERLGHAHAIAVDAEGRATAGADPRSDA